MEREEGGLTGKMFFVEEALYRWPNIYCLSKIHPPEMCLDHPGHRKYIVDPRKVRAKNVPGHPRTHKNTGRGQGGGGGGGGMKGKWPELSFNPSMKDIWVLLYAW